MEQKMIFFDIDGTLIDDRTGLIPDSTRTAIRRAQQRGHLLFVNTGRTICNIDPDVRALGFDGYVCGCGTHVELHGENLLARELGHDESVELVRALRELRMPAFFEGSGDVYGDPEMAGRYAELDAAMRMFRSRGLGAPVKAEDPSFAFSKFYIYVQPESDVEGFRAHIDGRFDWIERGGNEGEIVPHGFSKASGVDLLCAKLNIPLADCFAVGDSANDLSMLRHVPGSIAMGGSAPEIIPHCAYVTGRVLEDGIYKALAYFALI